MLIKKSNVCKQLDMANNIKAISVNHQREEEALDDVYSSLSTLIGGFDAFKFLEDYAAEVRYWLAQRYVKTPGVEIHNGC